MTQGARPPFDDGLERGERIAGLVYLPVHFVVWPLGINLLAQRFPQLTTGAANLLYYILGGMFLALWMLPWLRRQFDRLFERPRDCLLGIAEGAAVYFALLMLSGSLFLALGWTMDENPNNEALLGMTGRDWQVLKAVTIFFAPFLEETLVRGVVFGSLRRRSRLLAYLLTTLLFAVCHVWQYALAYRDATLWIYALQYVAPGLALCRCYERAGSIWPPVALHMLLNILAYSVL